MTARFLKNALFVIGAVSLLASLLANYVIINGFIAHPMIPVAELGETIPYEVKGKTVYITQSQKDETTAILVGETAGILILLIYGASVIYHRK